MGAGKDKQAVKAMKVIKKKAGNSKPKPAKPPVKKPAKKPAKKAGLKPVSDELEEIVRNLPDIAKVC